MLGVYSGRAFGKVLSEGVKMGTETASLESALGSSADGEVEEDSVEGTE